MSVPPESTRPSLDDLDLVDALVLSQRFGMIGSMPIAGVIEHSAAFLDPLVDVSGTIVDLGSGGGVPGLIIAWMRPDLRVMLVDRRATRTDHLERIVRRLRREGQIGVLTADAARLPRLVPIPVGAVVTRSFGSPRSVLRNARPLVGDHGIIVVSEPPPGAAARWAPDLLAEFGVARRGGADDRVAVLEPARST